MSRNHYFNLRNYLNAQKQRKHKKIKGQKKEKNSHEKSLHEQLKQLKTDANDDAQFILEHSGHTEKPTGAILSLTLGCLVLTALSVLIGCRMRRVNVRRRRHGKAVDADFLVNGMYLQTKREKFIIYFFLLIIIIPQNEHFISSIISHEEFYIVNCCFK